jgi:dipeptidyl aminopeptidase/acylaminoacyl peptidase
MSRWWRGGLGLAVASASLAEAQSRPVGAPGDSARAALYRRAEAFLGGNAIRRAKNISLTPRWTGSGDTFWYERNNGGKTEVVLIDPERNTRVDGYDRSKLPPAPRPAGPGELLSPDGRLAAFTRDYNLWVRVKATGEEIPLTKDGVKDLEHGGRGEAFQAAATGWRLGTPYPPAVLWSPDSKRLIAQLVDQRNTGELHMIEAVPSKGNRPRHFSYHMPFSGDDKVPVTQLMVFEIESRRMTPVQAEPLYILHTSPIDLRLVWWGADGSRAYFVREERGAKQLTLFEVDPTTGAARPIIVETSPTYAELFPDYQNRRTTVRVLGNGAEVAWFSERTGWGHLYLYDGATGQLKNPITRGDFLVRELPHVDEKARRAFVVASGKEPGRNPYDRHLYRVNLDGTGLTLLTPENGDHDVSFAPSGRYFIDRFSRADTVPTFFLRDLNGKVLRTLETGDLSELHAAGWRFPERFQAKARDGKTDIYGLIYRPTNFDPSRRYPILDDIYPGPQTIKSAIGFPGETGLDAGWFWLAQATAELGLIVITVEGLGTPLRSKAFHDFSYRNLGDAGGLDDHIAAIRQLAARYPYLDTTRVGISGASSGGYATLRALLTRGDFYKVGVSSVPYIGPTSIVAWWSDRYQGYPVDTANYRAHDLSHLAGNLQGKLLIALGGVDENADPYLVMPLLEAFVRADKAFDLVWLPTATHGGVGGSRYFIRRRWDFFARHLLGFDP